MSRERPTDAEIQEAFNVLGAAALVTMPTPCTVNPLTETGRTLMTAIQGMQEELEARRFVMAELSGWDRCLSDSKLATRFVFAQNRLRKVHNEHLPPD